MGRIDAVSLAGPHVGKIIVIQETSNFADATISELSDFEYWFHNETTLFLSSVLLISASNNNDWQQVTNILVDPSRDSNSGLDQKECIQCTT